MSARASDLADGYLSPLPGLLAAGGLDNPLQVIQISLIGNEPVPESSVNVEFVSIRILEGRTASVSNESMRILDGLITAGHLRRTFSIAIQMLNRLDFTGTFRSVDREAIVRLATIQVIDLLSREKPTLVVFMNTPHLFGDFLLFELARALNIRVLFFQSVPIAPVMIPKTSLGTAVFRSHASKTDDVVHKEVLSWARDRLESLFAQNPPPYISRQKMLSGRAGTSLARLGSFHNYIRWLRTPRFSDAINFTGSALPKGLATNFLAILLNSMLQRSLRARIEGLPSGPVQGVFALLALHYEPEKTVTPEGFPIEHQIEAVLRARSLLPEELHLVVKEHYSQGSPALRGYLGRSSAFYDLVGMLPNTTLIGPNADSWDLLRQARYVFTLTGTIALEAVASGVPVGYFGSPWWAGMPGSLRFQEDTEVSELDNVSLPSICELRDYCLDLVSNSSIPGIASEEPEDYIRRNGQLSSRFWEATVRGIAGQVLGELGVSE